MTPQDQGYRFVMRGGLFDWIHCAEMRSGDVDCTDMSDEEFARLVATVEEISHRCKVMTAHETDCEGGK